jgi:ribosomal-protein-alanine N-acetyltransferase
MMGQLEIRRMSERDIDEVWQIELDLFTMPWSRPSFLYEVSDSRNSYPVVGLEAGSIVGYAIAWFVADELHIGNVAVAKTWQGRGVGKQLLEHLLKEASHREVGYATLEVRVSNVKAIRLYRTYGFRPVALRKRYYSDNGEDAMVMFTEIATRDGGQVG